MPLPLLISNPHIFFSPMNIIRWNTRGAGSVDFRIAFRELCASYNPDLIILIETQLSRDRSASIISSFGFERYMKVDSMDFLVRIWIL